MCPKRLLKTNTKFPNFRSYKHNDPNDIDEGEISFPRQQVLGARKQLAAKKRRIIIISKLKPTKKFKWFDEVYKYS